MAVYSENLVAHNQSLALSDREIRHLTQRGESYREEGAYAQYVPTIVFNR